MNKTLENTAKVDNEREQKIRERSDEFIRLLTRKGILEDSRINDERVRQAQKEKRRNMYHNTRILLENYRNITWLLECFPDTVAEELETPLVVALAATALILLLYLILTRGNPMVGERGRLLTFLWLMLAAMAVTVQCETGALLATFVLAVQVVAALWLDSKNVRCPGTAGGICIQ